jgi:dihydroneopterin aldolase
MINIVEVNGIELYAYHGCMEEEAKLGGKYIVDISIQTDYSKSAASDELIDTIDYVAVRKIVVQEMEKRSKLIEHVGYRILNALKSAFPAIINTRVKIRKMGPPIEGTVKNVAIIIEG